VGLLFELAHRWWHIARRIRQHRIELSISISGISTAFPSWCSRIPTITITDTEDARLTNTLAFPFSTRILTPDFYLDHLGARHVRYRGLHELAYLENYSPVGLNERLDALDLSRPYGVLRLISYDALHDEGLQRPALSEILTLVERLKCFGRLYITSQSPLPPELEEYRLKIPYSAVHDVLAGAEFFIGESPTMAVEASLLGTPAHLITSRAPKLGNMVNLEKLGLLKNYSSIAAALEVLMEGSSEELFDKAKWQLRAFEFRKSCVGVTDFIYTEVFSLYTAKD
jgi:predicted glycosyltransferase